MYEIQAVANGWIVRPSPSMNGMVSTGEIHVFNDFSEMSGVLRGLLPVLNKTEGMNLEKGLARDIERDIMDCVGQSIQPNSKVD